MTLSTVLGENFLQLSRLITEIKSQSDFTARDRKFNSQREIGSRMPCRFFPKTFTTWSYPF